MIKTILRWTVLGLLLAYVVVAAAWARDEARRNTCKGIEVVVAENTSADSLTSAGVLAELRHFPKKIAGTPLHQLDTRAIEQYLEGMPQFEKINCNVTSSGKLRIMAVPMVPAARIFDGNDSYYINKDGKRMESKATYFVEVPVVSGTFSPEFTPHSVMPVVKFVESDKTLSGLVGMIYARDARDIYLVPRIHGHVVNFGDTANLEEKRDALLSFYRKVMPYKGWETYDTISVKYRGQVVASRRDKSRQDHGTIIEEGDDLEEATLPEI